MRKAKLRRCTECRRWYRPHRTACDHQKTCSAECRRLRRNRLARRRRRADLHECRDDERERQRLSRAQRQSDPARTFEPSIPSGPGLSRAGLELQTVRIAEQIVENLDSLARLSRASLERQVTRIARKTEPICGQKTRGSDRCHKPASTCNGS